VLERSREIGLLRVGRPSRSGGSGVSGWLGAIAWCGGALLGVPLAYAFVQTFATQVMPVDFYLDPSAFAVMLAAILVVATVASVAPSWRASRLIVAGLLRYE
jgi:ABC-type antimicrobial peptide transport system permease subunit